jgi:hypothetical protein
MGAYKKDKQGNYVFVHGNDAWRVGPTVGIVFDGKTGKILRHGDPKSCQEKLLELKGSPIAVEAVLIEDRRWPTTQLDGFLNDPESLGAWWQSQSKGAFNTEGLARA